VCGASSQQKEAFGTIKTLENTLRGDFQTIFGENQGILNMLEGSLAPQVRGGPGAYGFSASEDAARRGQATEQIAQAGSQAANAVRSAVASRGGGNTFLPSGSQEAIDAALAQDTAVKQAEAQLGITEQGYETGRENYFKSLALAGALPGELENPATRAGYVALGGAEAQEKGAEAITQANQAWMAPVAGMLGAVGGAAIGRFGGGGGGIPNPSINDLQDLGMVSPLPSFSSGNP